MRTTVIVSLLLGLFVPSVMAEGFVLKEENDLFSPRNRDRFYTQGLEIKYPGEGFFSETNRCRRFYGLRNIFYTPSNIKTAEPQPNDRPWAGMLAGTYTTWEQTSSEFVMTEWLLGVVGEWSQSGPIQTEFHKMIGSAKPQGWDNQIPSEPVVNVTMERYRPVWLVGSYDKWSSELSGEYGGSLGTAFVYGELGLILRTGYGLPKDYKTGLIAPVAVEENKLSLYGFAGAKERLVLHNIMLGGSFFQDGPSQELKPFVADVFVGVSLGVGRILGTMNDVDLSYSLVYRTREFVGQEDIMHYGSIIISLMRAF